MTTNKSLVTVCHLVRISQRFSFWNLWKLSFVLGETLWPLEEAPWQLAEGGNMDSCWERTELYR